MAEIKGYMTLAEEKGSINISEEVIAAIAVSAVNEVEGVNDLMTNKKGVKGVKVDMDSKELHVDLHLTVNYGYPIPEVAENVQKAVASSVEAMTGCTVSRVNIHVGGVTLA